MKQKESEEEDVSLEDEEAWQLTAVGQPFIFSVILEVCPDNKLKDFMISFT